MLFEMEKRRTKEKGATMRKKHRHEINAVLKHLIEYGPKESACLVSEVRNAKGERYRNFPTRNELSNLLAKDGRFFGVNQKQITMKGNARATWGVIGVHESLVDKVAYNTTSRNRMT